MADLLIKSKVIVTMDPDRNVLSDGYVLVRDGRIVKIGLQSEGLPAAEETLDYPYGLLMPGMIDSHYHTTQYFLRGKTQLLANRGRLRLPVWKKFFIPFEYSLSEEEAYFSAMGAYTNLIHTGTTCFAEAGGVHPEAMMQALTETGLRGVLAISTIDQGGLPEQILFKTDEALKKNADLITKYRGKANNRIDCWAALRQITICSPDLIREMGELARSLNSRVHIHLSEGTFEVDYCLEKAGVRPVQYLEKLELLGRELHAAHAAMITSDELRLIREYEVSCAHCPSSNFTLFEKPKVPEMRQMGIRMGIGTDGASHGSSDLLKEAKISYVGQISHFGAAYYDRHVVSDEDMVAMATIEGARALGKENEIGSLEVGKCADMILFSLKNQDVWPYYDPYYTIARCLSGTSVDTVIVDGKVLMKDRVLLSLDEDRLWEKLIPMAQQLAERTIACSWAERTSH